ncbi:hypothetical protein DKP78_25990, partial [Enterococcus faecium]
LLQPVRQAHEDAERGADGGADGEADERGAHREPDMVEKLAVERKLPEQRADGRGGREPEGRALDEGVHPAVAGAGLP